jgi:NifB/MoaA-like Fe-S oxidoreductase
VNDGPALEDTLAGILDGYPGLASVGAVPLGLSRFSHEPDMLPHSAAQAAAVLDTVTEWQSVYRKALGRRMVFAADEYYLMGERPFPEPATYEGFPQHENGIGMARAFEAAFGGDRHAARGARPGFFAAVDGAPASGYRATRSAGPNPPGESGAPIAVLSGEYGAQVVRPLVDSLDRTDIRVIAVANQFFGGNIGVAGLLTGHDLVRVLDGEPSGHRYLLPDSCLSEGRFLDDLTLADLPRPVEVVPTDGLSLRRALDANGVEPATPRVPVSLGRLT